MAAYLGIDLGTSSVKALMLDLGASEPLAIARAAYRVQTPAAGYAESNPDDWWHAATDAVRSVVSESGVRPRAVGLSGQMHGLVCTAASGSAVRPAMLWPDTRATSMLARYASLTESARARLANPPTPGMAGPMLCWLAAHEPEVIRATRWALQPKDWLRMRLTGVPGSEPSDASATLLYDVPGDRWDDEVVASLGLPGSLLAPLMASAVVAGTLSSSAATALGLAAGTPVAAGAADTAAAALGSGLTTPGPVQLTIGTGGQLVTPLDEPVAQPSKGTHLYRTAMPSGWYAMAATLNAGLALGWVRELFGVGWAELYAAARDPVRTDDPIFVPHLSGERTPYLDTNLRASWSGLGLNHDRATVLRAAMEGVAFALRDALEVLVGATAGRCLRLAGGGSQDPAWRQLVADVTGCALEATAVADTSARGAALLAAVADDAIELEAVGGDLAPAFALVAEPSTTSALHAERFATYRRRVTRMRSVGS